MNNLLNQLAAILNTDDKNLVITVAIKGLMDEGLTVRAAIDAVLGAGVSEKLVNEIYASLQAA